MALVGREYDSSEEEESSLNTIPASVVNPAPEVSLDDPIRNQLMLARATDTSLSFNAPFSEVTRAAQGPANPFKSSEGNALRRKNLLTGNAEEASLSDATFRTQYRTFQSLGYSKDPSANGAYVGDLVKAAQHEGKDVVQLRPSKEQIAAHRSKRQRTGDPSIVDGEGAYKGPWARYDAPQLTEAVSSGEELASDEEYEEEAVVPAVPLARSAMATDYQPDVSNSEMTEFHGSSQYDYQGRTYMHVPQDLDIDLRKEPGSTKNFYPKRQIHTWKAHTKAVNALRFFPNSGHLLLSASADAKVKLFDVYHSRELLRSYSGHTKSITDATFTPSGDSFLTSSYDRSIKQWDTETGACTARFKESGAIAHVVRYNPSSPHEFLAGMSNKKILQYDTRSGEMVQEYDHHLGPVNTITFVDEDRRFMTTSDDKSLRAWEYGIGVPIKFIAEPYMYSMVRSSLHPAGKYVAYQSGDNQIVVYSASDKFRQSRKKGFRGHNNAGQAIDVAISPDGNLIASGDSGGYLVVFDWKTCKMFHKIQAAKDGPVRCVAWHPQESSKMVTAGEDGSIKYWD